MIRLLGYPGFVGDHEVDRLLRIKTMYGFWPDADNRRYTASEPISALGVISTFVYINPKRVLKLLFLFRFQGEYRSTLASTPATSAVPACPLARSPGCKTQAT